MKYKDNKLSDLTTLRIGGQAQALFEAKTPDEVVEAAKAAASLGLPWRVIGHGSNVLAADEGISGAVIVFRDGADPWIGPEGSVQVSGGCPLEHLVHFLVARGLSGFELFAGIPGTVGGAVAGNAGAYGAAIGDRLLHATLLGKDGAVRKAEVSEFAFAYRHSVLKESREAVLEATFSVLPGDTALLERAVAEKLADRAAKHPDWKTTPTAGSWFKNHRGDDGKLLAAGRLLEEAGCRGLRVGGAFLWPKHANIVVTDGTATAAQVRELTRQMALDVFDRFGIQLVPEVCYLD